MFDAAVISSTDFATVGDVEKLHKCDGRAHLPICRDCLADGVPPTWTRGKRNELKRKNEQKKKKAQKKTKIRASESRWV